jgi:hypothetical protein
MAGLAGGGKSSFLKIFTSFYENICCKLLTRIAKWHILIDIFGQSRRARIAHMRS